MFNLSDFTPYDGSKLIAKDRVLIWSRATGYCFMTYGEVSDTMTVVAIED